MGGVAMDNWAVEGVIGVKITHVVAGIAGGAVRAFITGGGVFPAISSVFIGCLTAAYLTGPLYRLTIHSTPLPAEQGTENAIGFLVGLSAMLICDGVLRGMRQWSKNPSIPGGQK